ncbi:MAG: hypothetical protein HN737_12325 [Desulfobacterales bacterium]|jgi:uncharacterized protein involved in outer membrane biogenesis|nr:hypothetical protein [Desulfobacteraceae bacterium]MBT7698184.1 hypothetical protein [Desulfobacterales bacterium]
MKKLLIFGCIAFITVVVAVLVILGNIDRIVKEGVNRTGPMILKAPVSINDVDISFFSGSGKLSEIIVGNPKGYKTDYAFQMESIMIDLDVGSVASEKIHVKNILIDSPSIIFEGGFTKNNLKQLQANAKNFTGVDKESAKEQEKTVKSKKDSTGKKIQIDYIKIENASISVSMAGLGDNKFTIPLPMLEIKDIGKEEEATISDAIDEIIGAINKSVAPAVKSGMTGIGKGSDKTGEVIKDGINKIKGFFSK